MAGLVCYNITMSLQEQIKADFKAAMLEHDEVRKLTISGLKSAMQYKKVALGNQADLTEDQMLDVVAAQVKQRDDSIAIYQQAGDTERAAAEQAQRDILAAYLPKPLSADELSAVAHEVITANNFTMKDMGKAIAAVKAKVGHAATGGDIAAAVKRSFNQ